MPRIIDKGGCTLLQHNENPIPIISDFDIKNMLVLAEFGIKIANAEGGYSCMLYNGSISLNDKFCNSTICILVTMMNTNKDYEKEEMIYSALHKPDDGPHESISFNSTIGDTENSVKQGYYRLRLYIGQSGCDQKNCVIIDGPVTIQATSYVYKNGQNIEHDHIEKDNSNKKKCIGELEHQTNNRTKIYSGDNIRKGTIVPYSSSYRIKLGANGMNKYIETVGNGVSASLVYNRGIIDKKTIFSQNELGKIIFVAPKNGSIGKLSAAFTQSNAIPLCDKIAIRVSLYVSKYTSGKYTDYILIGGLNLLMSNMSTTASSTAYINGLIREHDRICLIAYNEGNYTEESGFYKGIIEGHLSAGLTFV